jgi:hypothetical protein
MSDEKSTSRIRDCDAVVFAQSISARLEATMATLGHRAGDPVGLQVRRVDRAGQLGDHALCRFDR